MKAIRKTSVILGVAAILTLATAAPAFAGYAQCREARQACLFEDPGGQGSQYAATKTAGKYELDWWNGDNEISSLINYSSYCLTLYSNDGWTGRTIIFGPGQTINVLSEHGWDNDVESYKLSNCS